MTPRPASIFDLNSCRDVLGKLERELVRLEYSLDRFDRADHAANFAIWAWRLTDWVYREIAVRPPLRRRFAEACVSPVASFDLDGFQRYVVGGRGCPALASCRAIATAYGPDESGDRRPPGGTRSAVVLQLHPEAGDRRPDQLTRWQGAQWLVSDGTGPVPDVELFNAVLQFWTDFIHANHIA